MLVNIKTVYTNCIPFLVIIISIQVVYADLDVNLKANSTPAMQHPVVYALIDGSSLAPRSIENNTPCKCACTSCCYASVRMRKRGIRVCVCVCVCVCWRG